LKCGDLEKVFELILYVVILGPTEPFHIYRVYPDLDTLEVDGVCVGRGVGGGGEVGGTLLLGHCQQGVSLTIRRLEKERDLKDLISQEGPSFKIPLASYSSSFLYSSFSVRIVKNSPFRGLRLCRNNHFLRFEFPFHALHAFGKTE